VSSARRPRSRRRRDGTLRARASQAHGVLDVAWDAFRWIEIDRALAPLEPSSTTALLSAAVDSPAGGHRLPGLSLLWARSVTHPPDGVAPARPADLRRLLAAARKTAPQLRLLEDCWQSDPRFVVRHSAGGERLRVHPGAYTDPSQTLRVLASAADAVDDVVLDRHGFALSDLIEAALRYSDWRLALVAPAWPAGPIPKDEPAPDGEDVRRRVKRIASAPVVVDDDEVDAVVLAHAASEAWTTRCAYPDRAAVAWAWATVPADGLEIVLEPRAQTFGTALAIDTPAGPQLVPAAMVISALTAATGRLAAEVAGDAESTRRLQTATEARVLDLLRTPAQVAPSDTSDALLAAKSSLPRVGLGMTILPAARHAFALMVASGLGARELSRSLDEADTALDGIDAHDVRNLGVPLDATGVVCRIVIYGGPLHEQRPGPGQNIHVHVEDLASVILDAQRCDLGPDLVFQFLDEAACMPGVEHLFNTDFTDLWRHWKRHGVINPTGIAGVAVAVDPTPDDEAWTTSAAWEPIEAALDSGGLPPVSDWHIAKLDEPGQATFWTASGDVCLVLTDLPLIVGTVMGDTLGGLGLDRAFGSGIADGLLLTALRFPGVAAALATPDGSAMSIVIQFTMDRSAPDDEHVAIGVVASRSPVAIGLLLGPDWLELLATDAHQAHRVLGQALLHGIEQLREPSGQPAWDAIRGSFITAWETAPPVVLIQFAETTIDYRAKGQVSLPRSHASRARARRLLAREVVHRKVPAGLYRGAKAIAIANEQIVPAVHAALAKLIGAWSREAVLAVAEHLNDAYAERARAASELEQALAAPWASNWRTQALEGPDAVQQTRPLELVLESLVAEPPTGVMLPDRFDIAEVADLAYLAVEMATALVGAERRLHSLAVIVDKGGVTHVLAGPDGPKGDSEPDAPDAGRVQFDLPSYLALSRADRFRPRAEEVAPPDAAGPVRLGPNRRRVPQPFQQLKEMPGVPKSLLVADEEMRSACGTGLDGLHAVLGTAVTWIPDDDHVVQVRRQRLRQATLDWSDLSESEIDAAIEHLVLDPAALRAEGIAHWDQERRRHRLTIRPLLPAGDDLIIMPWGIDATKRIYAGYLEDGRLPWHPGDVPDAVRNALGRYRQISNNALEGEAGDVAAGLGLPHKRNIKPHQALVFGLDLPGEMDLLVADASRGRLWVCEVKDVYAAVSPRTLQTRIDNFLDSKDGHIAQLTRLTRAVTANADAAASLLSCPAPSRPWRVLPLMITRRVEPAAFVNGITVTFTVPDDLAETLQADIDPDHGHTPVRSAWNAAGV
jgi:hypothetical protein